MFNITTPNDVILFEEEEEEEETTSQDSSSETETPAGTDGEEGEASSDGASASGEQTVPYSRFKEVNDRLRAESESKAEYERKLKEYEAKLQPQDPKLDEVKKVLDQLGYVTKDSVEADLRKQREDAKLDLELSRLENKLDGKDGLPKFKRQEVIDFAIERGISDPEVAYRTMHFDKIVDWNVKNALGKTGGVKSEKSDGSGSSQAGATDSDLKEAAAQGDRSALHTLIKRIASASPDSN